MTIALLATGNEITHGDTLNTNSYHIAQTLASEGLEPGLHVSCSDNEQEIHDSIGFLANKHDIVIITGGLGPTSDDKTRFALAKFLNTPLIESPEAIAHIQSRIWDKTQALTKGNRQQALFPANTILLPNPNGTAMGCYYSASCKLFILLPGPPRECLPMFNLHVLPLLQQTKHNDKQLTKWRIFGVSESEIAQRLDDALAHMDCETGYRWEAPYIEFKVSCRPELLEEISKIVNPLIAPHIIATTEFKASEALYNAIQSWNKPITIIDEVTGGILQSLLLRPGTHHLLNFYDDHRNGLVCRLQGLEEYWTQKQPGGTTSVSISLSHDHQTDTETHSIPYRSSMVIDYATEWLCFRLFHLINQLHQ